MCVVFTIKTLTLLCNNKSETSTLANYQAVDIRNKKIIIITEAILYVH